MSANNFAIFATNGGTIEDLNVTGTLTLANGGSTSRDYVAAVVGTNSGTINKVTSSTTVNASNTYNVGGIAGYNTGYILNSANSGAVNGYARVGGIVGDNEGTVNSCSNTAQVKMFYSGKGGVGGIAGFNGDKNGVNTAHIWNCYNTGYIVSGTPGVSSTQGSWVGGICGFVNVKSDCVNCYNTSAVSGYQYLDHISGNTEGTNTNCYGLKTVSGPQGYDGATGLTKAEMQDADFLTTLNAGNVDDEGESVAFWTQSASVNEGYPTLTKAATKDSSNPAEHMDTFTVVVYTSPTKLTYNVGETFDPTGMVIRAVYADGRYETITNYTVSPSGTLTASDTSVTISGTYKDESFSLTIAITVNSTTPTTTTVYVNGSAAENGTGTAASPYNNLADAVVAAGDGGIVVVLGTVTLPSGQQNGAVTVKRGDNFSGPLFKVASGTVTLTSMTIDGQGTGTLVEVTGGTLVLRGGVKLQNCATAVDVQAGGAVTVNKATISASQYSVKVAGSTSTFTLEDFGGTSISGTVYLGSGAVITVGAAVPNTLTVECADFDDSISPITVAVPASGVTLTPGQFVPGDELGAYSSSVVNGNVVFSW